MHVYVWFMYDWCWQTDISNTNRSKNQWTNIWYYISKEKARPTGERPIWWGQQIPGNINLYRERRTSHSAREGKINIFILRSSHATSAIRKSLGWGIYTWIKSVVESTLLGKIIKERNETLWGITTNQKVPMPTHFLFCWRNHIRGEKDTTPLGMER